MKKNISKILVAIMVFSMMLGVGMVKDAYATISPIAINCVNCTTAQEPGFTCYKCPLCTKEFHIQDYHDNPYMYAISHIQDVHNGGVTGTSITLENSSLNVQSDTLNKTDGTDYFADETTNIWNSGTIKEETRV